ncbi:MAG: PAS domain S-box protein [Chloroflexi bacterium]|nr:PAS domain S-box protein [Chloroflexota bacterium]
MNTRETFQDWAELLPQIAFVLDAEGKVTYANQQAFDAFGYTPEELDQGLYALQMFIPEGREGTIDTIERLLNGERISEIELTAVRKDGNTFPVIAYGAPIIEKGISIGVRGFIVDISERKQSEEELQQKEEYFRAVIENSADAFVILNTDGTVRYRSPSYERILGHNPDKSVESLFERIHPDDVEEAAEMYAHVTQKPGEIVKVELHVKASDGNWIPIEADGQNLIDNPAVGGIVVSFRDITERQEAEDALKFRSEFEGLITAISTQFINISAEEMDSEITESLRLIGEFVGVDRSYVFQYSADGTTISNTHEWCAEGIEPQIDNLQDLSVEEASWMMDTLEQSNVFYIPCIADLPPEAALEKELLEAQGIQSLIMVPMKCGGSSLGSIGFDSVRTRRVWSDDSIRLLQMVGRILANALARKQAEKALRKAYQEVEQLVKERTANLAEINIQLVDEIAERKLVERELLENKSKLLKAQSVAKMGFLDWNLKTNEIELSDEIIKLYGLDPEAKWITPDLVADVVYFEDIEFVQNNLELALKGREYNIDHRVIRPDGEVIWVQAQADLIYDDDGNAETLLGTAIDITERKQAEEALQESEQKFREMANLLPQVVYEIDTQGNLTFINEHVYDSFGYSINDVMKDFDVFQILIPEDRDRAQENMMKILDDKQTLVVEYTGVRKDNSTFPVITYTSPIIKHNRPAGLRGIVVDITERKQAEEELRETLDRIQKLNIAAFEGIVIAERGRIIDANPAFISMFGYKNDEIVGRDVLELVAPKSMDYVIQRVKEKFLGRYEGKALKKDGTIFDVEVCGAQASYGGRTIRITALNDVTDRKQSEAKLHQYSIELQDANEELTRYAEVASHDICTPLRAIRYYTHLLRKQPKNISIKQRQSYLDTIDTAVREGEDLAKNLLVLSHLGQNEIRQQKVDVGKLLEKVIVSSGLSEDKGIVMKKDWPTIKSDPTLLGQIFRNLIDNAVKFRSDPTGRIEISWKTVKAQGYEFTVLDHGIGIDSVHHEEIFEIFKKLHHKEEYPGTGIGLAIVKKAANRLGGSIRVKSKPGKGSSFIVQVPGNVYFGQNEQKSPLKTRKRSPSKTQNKRRSSEQVIRESGTRG